MNLSISQPNHSNKLDSSLRYIKLTDINPWRRGDIMSEDFTLSYDTSGTLKNTLLYALSTNRYKVIATDNTTYAVVYECTKDASRPLNYSNDNVHIFSRSETVTTANLTTWKATAEAAVTGSSAKFETLKQTGCLATSYTTRISELFSNPTNFFRKW